LYSSKRPREDFAQPNRLMQPTNAGKAGDRPRPSLPVATEDHRFSLVVCI